MLSHRTLTQQTHTAGLPRQDLLCDPGKPPLPESPSVSQEADPEALRNSLPVRRVDLQLFKAKDMNGLSACQLAASC